MSKNVLKLEKHMVRLCKDKFTRAFIENTDCYQELFNLIGEKIKEDLNVCDFNIRYDGSYSEDNTCYWLEVEIW